MSRKNRHLGRVFNPVICAKCGLHAEPIVRYQAAKRGQAARFWLTCRGCGWVRVHMIELEKGESDD